MNNIIFWAHSYCRSTLQFYSELAKCLQKECVIYTWIESLTLRTATGFNNAEFSNLKIQHVGNDMALAEKLLSEHIDDYHVFCAYQTSPIHQHLIGCLIDRGIRYGIISEAPCNMDKFPKRAIKELYIRYYLPIKLTRIIENADFCLNLSGYYERELKYLGWDNFHIISCGYFPPRIPGSTMVERKVENNTGTDFTILLSGLHQWHRSPWLLLKALKVLKKRGYTPHCYITQEGPYLKNLKQYAIKHHLDNVEFLGFVELPQLIHLYETCSAYIGCGNYEPWGMRLNDCLLCGSPLIVNRGMGGVKMVDEYGCGLSFERNDAVGLADAIQQLMTDKTLYSKVAQQAIKAANAILPENAAIKYAEEINKRIIARK